MDTITSFYKFVTIEEPAALRQELAALTHRLSLMGTILLAHEGINGTVAGPHRCIDEFKATLSSRSAFADLEFKDSVYADTSFRRMLVKVKKEIITMRQEVDPQDGTGCYVEPLEFKKWQDEGKEMLLIDTRNAYEVALGTFRAAADPAIKSFGEFPAWVDQKLGDAKEKTIVTFCTGGIRCEKATAYMKKQGFQEVYQLKGGILKYFEETLDADGDNHWQGECVVFDKRKAVNKRLEPSDRSICYICLCELCADNRAPELRPAGELCQSCAHELERGEYKRSLRGRQRHHENLQQRKNYLRSERERFAAKAAGMQVEADSPYAAEAHKQIVST